MNPEEETRAQIEAWRVFTIETGLQLMGINAIVSKGMVHLTIKQFDELFGQLLPQNQDDTNARGMEM